VGLEPERIETQTEDHDPLVLAYRMGRSPGVVRVRRSELRKDPNLFEIPKSSQSRGYDPYKTLSQKIISKRAANPYVERKIQFKLMIEDIKKRAKEKGIDFKAPENLDQIKSLNDHAAQFFLEIVTESRGSLAR
jgi:hypothetical protein